MKKFLALLVSLALLLCTLPALAQETLTEPVSITIFHTNDVHSRYDTADGMGYAMMATYVSAARENGENVLVLDAGDTLHGTVFANYTKGESILELMNAMGYAAMAPGNHDFNYGFSHLEALAQTTSFPLLSANILKEDGTPAFDTHVIVEIAGKKIAIVGAQNPALPSSIHPDAISSLTFAGVEEIQKVVSQVRPLSDAVIILTHWGCDGSLSPNSVEALASIPGVTLVIDGHSHTSLYDIEQSADETHALVTSTGEYLSHLGKVTLTFEEDMLHVAAQLIADPGVYEEHGMLEIIQQREAAQDALLDEVIGSSAAELPGDRLLVRTQETALGNLICDILLDATGADCAILNGGGIRASLPQGDITIRNVNTIFPFSNYVVVVQATGETIQGCLEAGCSVYPEENGGFSQVGNLSYTFDPSLPAGSRVTEVLIGGNPLDPTATYSLATNDYLAAGGDDYPLTDSPVLLSMGYMDEIVVEYLREHPGAAPAVEGRITVVE